MQTKRTNRSRVAFFTLSIALVAPLLTSTLSTASAQRGEGRDSLYKYLSVFTEVLRLVRQVYVEETDIQSLMAGALDGATDALDPFSVYVPAERIDEYRQTRAIGTSRSGILVLKERGVAYVAAVAEGSPARQAGVEAADIISEIRGVSTRDMPLWQLRGLLAGDVGDEIALEIIRRGSNETIDLVLGDFTPLPVAAEDVRGIQVVRIPHITAATPAQLDSVLAKLGDQHLLIDLRGSSGGQPEIAYEVAERFVTGELGSLRTRNEVLESYSSTGTPAWDGEVSLLVDRGSQGASEVLAEILRGSGHRLMGETTFGHAGRNSLIELASGGYLDITDGFFTGPDGEPLAEGLEPDLELDVRGARWADDAEGDPVLEEAIEAILGGLEAEEELRDVA